MGEPEKTKMLGFYAEMVDRWVFRWKRAALEARKRTYTPENMTADVVSACTDGVDWVSYPWKLITEELTAPPLPILVSASEQTAWGTAEIADPGGGSLTLEDLTERAGSKAIVVGTHLTAALANGRRTLVVALKDLHRVPIATGEQYTGKVKFGVADDLVAQVVVNVTD